MAVDVESLYQRHGPMVLRRCRTLLRDEEAAVDAMHDVFVLLQRNAQRLENSGPSSLLYRMATHVCLNQLRARKRRPEDPQSDLLQRIAGAADPEAQSAARLLLDRIFSREQASTGTIAVLHLLDGMTLEEVAQEVGLSVSGVRKRLRSLRSRVQELEQLA